MEPMTLGSPPSSPNQSPSNFLPAFLLGEGQSLSPRMNSPSKNRPGCLISPTSSGVIENRNLQMHQKLYPHSFIQEQQNNSGFNISSITEKSRPPSKGLFDTVDSPNDSIYASPIVSRNETKNTITSPVNYSTPQKNLNYTRNLNESLQKSTKRNLESVESLWVTVLGFPPHAASLVLSQFAQCGAILDKKFPSEGNWIHLKYSSEYEVAKALSLNGKLISNSIMVGVLPYIFENKENSNFLNESSNSHAIASPNRARPLTQSFIQKQSSNEVLPPQNLPQKSTGIVSKAMEYVFGW